jgi:predicted secreted protein
MFDKTGFPIMFTSRLRKIMQVAFALGALATLFCGSAEAGDAAARRIIGFSADGRYFAFEQYGTLDWSESDSGWSEIRIIDTTTSTVLGDKPIRVIDESGTLSLTQKDARKQAQQQATPLLAHYAITSAGKRIGLNTSTRPGDIVTYAEINPLEEVSPKTLFLGHDLAALEVSITPKLAASTEDCASTLDGLTGDKTDKARGFRLVLADKEGKQIQLLHEDGDVPAARNCPTSYSISEAYAFKPRGKPPVVAVLVQYFSQGWEGRDRRFMAVTAVVKRH